MLANDQPLQGRVIRPLVIASALFMLELLVIGVVFKHAINFTCLSNWPAQACRGSSGLMISLYCMTAGLALFALLFPDPFVKLFSQAGQRRWPLALNISGAFVAMMPVLFLAEGTGATYLVPTLACWTIGMGALLAGLLLYLAPPERWVIFVREEGKRLLPFLAAAAMAPILATLIRPLWQLETIAFATFTAVALLIELLGYQVEIYPQTRVIGVNDFYVNIAPVCSGIEGIALVTIFTTLYLFLFKSALRFPRVLLLYPIGIAVSASLNVVRIVILLVIGFNGNPELAVGGFHSHAGWLMFTIVALGIIVAANTVAWLRKPETVPTTATTGAAPVAPFFQDPVVAMILPFAIFMLSAMLAQAFSQTPGVIYPARAVLMAGALLVFLPFFRKLDWRLDPVAIGVGGAIGLIWCLIPVADPDTTPPYGTLTGALLVLWFVARGIGTVVLVPVIEEAFFRGYLEQKLKLRDNLTWAIGAAIVVAALFAVLHGRWAEAFVASLAFSYVMHRSGRLSDAIVSHAAANILVFSVAVATGQVHII